MTTKQEQGRVYHIVMFSFADTTSADAAVKEIKEAQKTEGYKVVAEAVVIREADGSVHIHEPGRGGVGGTVGAVAGGLLGLLGGPVGVLALAVTGGVAGGIAGHFMGRAIPAEDLKKAGESLPPNTSAFLVLVEDIESETLIKDLAIPNANVVTLTVGDELSGVIVSAMDAEVGAQPAAAGSTSASAASQPAAQPVGQSGTQPTAPSGNPPSTSAPSS
ncbi:MAG: DUF1269 domain-containing protein [Dehalococcoidia bacterium]